MAKKIKKYNIGGEDNPCGEGTIWDATTQKCVPTQWYTPSTPGINPFANKGIATTNSGDVVSSQDFNIGAYATNNGTVIKSDIINNNPRVVKDARGNIIPNQNVIGDAVDQGFNYDSDGVYRKTETTTDENKLGFSDGFKVFNAALDATKLIAGTINDASNTRKERIKLLKARTGQSKYNVNEQGINNIPAYFKKGGSTKTNNSMFSKGGKNSNPQELLKGLDVKLQSGQITQEEYGRIYRKFIITPEGQQYINQVAPNSQYTVTWRDETSPNKQRSIKFENKETWQDFVKNNKQYNPQSVTEHENGGNASGYYQFKTGGQDAPIAELEKGEVFQTTQGDITKVPESHATHENGGSVQEDVYRVLEDTGDKRQDIDSKLLLISPDEAFKLTGFKPKKTITHSKLFEEASNFHNRKMKSTQKTVDGNIDYVTHKNGGLYAQASLEQNLKLMERIPNEDVLFNNIYNHQEQIKQKYSIDQEDKMQNGGKTADAIKITKNEYNLNSNERRADGEFIDGRWYPNGLFLNEYGNPSNEKNDYGRYVNGVWQQSKPYLNEYGLPSNEKNDQGRYINGVWHPNSLVLNEYDQPSNAKSAAGRYINGIWHPHGLHLNEYDYPSNEKNKDGRYINGVWHPNGNTETANATPNKSVAGIAQPNNATGAPNTGAASTPNTGAPNTGNMLKYQLQGSAETSKFNEPLRWYDVAGDIMNYASSINRTPVDLEQLQRDQLKVHELNPLPTLLQNQGDYNAALAELPSNGVGFANQANLQAQKYKVNNEVLGQYENQNKTRQDQVDQVNSAANSQIDQANLGLRDQFVNRVLQGKEVQRQSKLNALDDLFTKIAQNRKLNREGQLVLELTPYFDQYGKFNGNRYNAIPTGNVVNIVDKTTGKVVKTTTTQKFDEMNQLKGTSVSTTQKTN